MNPRSARNVTAFLDAIAVSEIGRGLLDVTDDGYNVLVGATPARPKIFLSYAVHPRVRDEALNSDAAGRYQFMGRYWAFYRLTLKLPDFGPMSQRKWALRLVSECRATDFVLNGEVEKALHACRSRWASLPGAGYGQHENKLPDLVMAYQEAGGTRA